jgi:DNA-directed RNA polymerase subunit RPC12/RpoP
MLKPGKTQIARAMSEFKYACPVCGQHMKCDSSQSGTVMECPTCFQKITAPQAPETDDPKFIITGTKVGERPIPAAVAGSGAAPARVPQENSSLPAIAFIVLLCAAAVALFAFHGRIFTSTGGQGAPGTSPPQKPVRPLPPPKPALVAPPATDALWMLNLDAATIPGSPAAGRIHGQDFIVEQASFRNGTLVLRAGTHGPMDYGITIGFSGAQAEALVAQSINVTTNTEAAAGVTLRWNNNANSGRVSFNSGYALRLEFGVLMNNHLPGKIYLCTPDAEKSYLLGIFDAEIYRPRPLKPR